MNLKHSRLLLLTILTALLLFAAGCQGSPAESNDNVQSAEEPKDLILATTTSTQDSGLLDELIPIFEEEENINVKTIAVGTGQALEMGTQGEADVLLVHAPAAEQEIVDSGDAINRKRVMYNDFIMIGPKEDPAGVSGLPVQEAFVKISEENAVFISRGDDSGTHKKELGIWEAAGITPSENSGYTETGQGMGDTLQIAADRGGYVLTDRATFLAHQDTLGLSILVEGDEGLLNIYHVMQVNPEKHNKVYAEGAEAFGDFMVSDETQKVIEEFGKDEYGEALFFKYTE
ncbi:substrate-binding domain-containing protein [Cytobacillus gottheilii]|uniref:Substrate-binding domain-containing protein n=1 Tax=Cytobacillus gottheilii TaxID=859144 RepID=A0ABX8F9B8_9BACI|nr:substrate-binding domain-containing protein [Cytobacillus gottheilii]